MQEKYPVTEDDLMDGTGEPEKYLYEEGVEDNEIETVLDTQTLLTSENIAALLTEDELQNIAEECLENYEADKLSRSHREPAMEKAMNLALHITRQKDTPWKNASNVIYPLISNAAISFAARAYPAIVRDDEVVDFKVIGSDEGQPQPTIQNNHIMVGQDGKPVIQMVGKGLKKARGERVKSYMNYQFSEEMENWEEDTDRLAHSLPITGTMFRKKYWCADEQRMKSHLVYPKYLIVNDKTSSMERAPCISEELEYYPHEIEEFIRSGVWLDFNFADDSAEKEVESEREKDGESDEENSPLLFIEQLCRKDLDKDGYPEPYIVRIHKGLKKVVNIIANYKPDRIKLNSKGQICRIIPETYYIKYDFIPSPDGSFYSIGFGELLLHMNETINTLINQLIDAGTLATTSSGFIGRGLRIKGGNVQVKKGEYVQVDTRGGGIKDNFVQIQHPEPSDTLFKLLGLLLESAKDLGSLKDVLAGEQMSSQQSPTTTLTLIEQGLTAFKAIYKRIARSVKKEIQALYRLNSLYLNQEPAMNGFDISQQDFSGNDFSIIPASAPHMVSDMQRLARASFMETYKDDPYVNGLELRTRIFDIAGIDNLDTLLKQPDPPPPDPNMEMVKVQQQLGMAQMQIERDKNTIAAGKNQIEELKAQLAHVKDTMKIQVDGVKAQADANVKMATVHKIQAETNNLDARSIESLANADNLSAETFEFHKREVESLSGNQ
jgi:chaperonin GroES